ncbi:MAG: aminotransferase class I/II-fold pyridoxal phosphate-dependent enzyme [Bifidobacteriaceae bacterium]|jgi:cystathionine beta-lyase|nr:aminotransferase class I/II-fold pyridoxal phosphate-dependent enzyme [Bifidobacteriaceae bacterium]
MGRLFETFSLDELRLRTSEKWTHYAVDVLPLWVAEMDTPPLDAVVQTVDKHLRAGDTGYLNGTNERQYMESCRNFCGRHFSFAPNVEHARLAQDVITALTGVTHGFLNSHSDLTDNNAVKGVVVVSTPCYPPFVRRVSLGFEIIDAPLAEDYHFDLQTLESAFEKAQRLATENKTRALYILCNPHNPSGTVPTRVELEKLAKLSAKYDIAVLADEVHCSLIHPNVEFTPYLSVTGVNAGETDAVSFQSASKGFNLSGLKAAMAIPSASQGAVDAVANAPGELLASAGQIATLAHTAAFNKGDEFLAQLNSEIAENASLAGGIIAHKFPNAKVTQGGSTYFLWVDFSAYMDIARAKGYDSMTKFLIDEAKVAFTNGENFSLTGNEFRSFVRINLATSRQLITLALDRVGSVL